MKTFLAVLAVIMIFLGGISIILTAGLSTPVCVVFGFVIGSLLVAATKKKKDK